MKIKGGLFIFYLIWVFFSCKNKGEKSEFSLQDIRDLKTQQYAINGKVLYDNLCANCHQKDGTGLGRVIPPLDGADYMKEDVGRTIRIIKYGLNGDIIVNGVHYNQPMPPNPQLTHLEIAEIATYIYHVWGNQDGLIDIKDVQEYLEQGKAP